MHTTAIVDLICAVFMAILYSRHLSERRLSKSSGWLNRCLFLMFFTLIIDALAYTLVGPSYPLAVRYFINLMSFLGAVINATAFTFYSEALFEEKGVNKPGLFSIVKFVEIIWLLATVYEYIAGNLLTYDANGVENLDYFYRSYIVVIEIFVLVYLLAVTLFNRKTIGKELTLLMSIFIIAPIINTFVFTLAGIDFSYAFTSVILGFVAEFIQKKQVENRILELEKERIAKRINEEERKALEENNARILALEDSFVSLYDVDLETGKYSIYAKSHILNSEKVNIMVNDNDFFGDTLKNAELVVIPEDREELVKVLSREFIMETLDKESSFDWHYRLIAEGEPAWAKMRFAYKDEEKTHVIVGVFNAEEEMKAKQLADVKQTVNMISSLADEYNPIIVFNAESGEYDWHNSKAAEIERNTPMSVHGDNLYELFEPIRQGFIHEEDRERFDAFYNKTNMMQIAETGEAKETENRWWVPEQNMYRWKYNKAVRMFDESGKALIVVGVVDTTEKKEKEAEFEAQQKQLKDTMEALSLESKRNNILIGIIDAGKFTYEFNADDEVINANYADISKDRIGAEYLEKMRWIEILHPEDKERVEKEFMAAIRDHSGNTPYDTTFRMMGTDGKYRWVKSGGNIIRHADGSGELFGISVDITNQMEEQQKRLLGAVALSPDVLSKANIGMWAFELDEGEQPRMYADETMLRLIGLDHQVEPEKIYHAWYDYIDEGSYDLVHDAVAKMSSGEHAEVQYPWHHPDGHTIVVRCGGIRNPEYTKGIRIEGTHQDVSQTLHYDEKERERAKQIENELVVSKLRADSLAYIEDNDPSLDKAIDFFGKRILEISGCDQVVYREPNGNRTVINAPGVEDIPKEICARCPFAKFDVDLFGKEGAVLMNDCSLGWNGVMAPDDCPAKSSFMQLIYSGGELVGKLTVHYLKENHAFSENMIDIMKIVAVYMGLLIGRIKTKQAEIARIEAESSNKAKTDFLFNMSHDIRTPMNAIIGFTDQAIRHKDNPELLDSSLTKVKDSSAYLLRIVNDILDMAKIESGKLELKDEICFTGKGANALIDVFGAEAAKKGIEFHTSYDIKDNYIWLDDSRTSQIVANLISNSIKYTEPGGEIWYSVKQAPCEKPGYGKFVVSVKDTGCGMSPEFVAKIFDAFERDAFAKQSQIQGTGLGMAIVKKLADAMGATIEIQSELGKGSTVVFTAEHRIATAEEIEKYKADAAESEKDTRYDFSGKRTLLVEDNELNREIANDILDEEGIVVEDAENGLNAVQMLKDKGPDYYDFILMDIQMPVMNGYEATRKIREMYPDSRIPVIALSANAFEEDKAASLAAGMDDHVAKPIDIKELFRALAKFL